MPVSFRWTWRALHIETDCIFIKTGPYSRKGCLQVGMGTGITRCFRFMDKGTKTGDESGQAVLASAACPENRDLRK